MPDERVTDDIATEVDSSDARSAEEFLFGHADEETAHGPAATGVAEWEDSHEEVEEEAEQEPQGSGEAGKPDVPVETETADELKVVMSIKGGRATIGVQRPSADPHIEAFDDADPSGLAQQVAAVVERARARWQDEPKYPAHQRPASPARPQRRRQQEPPQASTDDGEVDQQQPETLRLF